MVFPHLGIFEEGHTSDFFTKSNEKSPDLTDLAWATGDPWTILGDPFPSLGVGKKVVKRGAPPEPLGVEEGVTVPEIKAERRERCGKPRLHESVGKDVKTRE